MERLSQAMHHLKVKIGTMTGNLKKSLLILPQHAFLRTDVFSLLNSSIKFSVSILKYD